MANSFKRPRMDDGGPHKRLKMMRQKLPHEAASVLPDEAVDAMMEHSIGLIFKSKNFDGIEASALRYMQKSAENFMTGFLDGAMRHAQSQRRDKPTIVDVEDTLQARGITTVELEEAARDYQKNRRSKRPYTVTAELLPSTQPEPDTQLASLLGAELIQPRVSTITKTPKPLWQQHIDKHAGTAPALITSKNTKTERSYIEAHHPQLPSRHTYAATSQPVVNRGGDPKQIREQATEQARLAAETLRKYLAALSQAASAPKDKSKNKSNGKVIKVRKVSEARAARDAIWKQVWDDVSLANANDGANGDGHGKEKAWLDTVVNTEKDFYSKGRMKRVLKKPIVIV